MRKLFMAAAATVGLLSTGALSSAPAQAMSLGASSGLRPAADTLSLIDKTAYCEYFDPSIGDYVSFYVPGPCLVVGAPGYDLWLGRYYRGHRFWRGRVGARPWLGARGRVGVGRVGVVRGGAVRTGGARIGGARVGGGRVGGGRVGGGRVGGGRHH